MRMLAGPLVAILSGASLGGRSQAQVLPPIAPDSMHSIVADSVCDHEGFPFVGPSETLHGRLFLSNGPPTVRLWKVGTSRILGVWDSGEASPPPCLLPW